MSGLFGRVARPAILAASRSDRLRRIVEGMPVTRDVVHRFVPGETADDVLASVAGLRASRRFVSVDYLGEHVTDAEAADATVQAYLGLLDVLGNRGEAADGPRRAGAERPGDEVRRAGAERPGDVTAPLEVSLKLSALGQALPRDGEKIAYENAHAICQRARDVVAWVTVDAEDHTTTDSTLSIVRDLRNDYDWLGTVLQAYLRRTAADCAEFAASGARIRLCKGAYDEPASVAFRDNDDVTDSYLRCLRLLMAGNGYPMVASHDPAVIAAVPGLVAEFGRSVGDFEYQMLYGIRDAEQRRLAGDGNQVRVYVPFGTQWYGYFARRLAERPANLTFFLRALTERR
jgi:proline dehydrogenase